MRERYFCAMPGDVHRTKNPCAFMPVLFLRLRALPIYLLCRSITPQTGIKAEKAKQQKHSGLSDLSLYRLIFCLCGFLRRFITVCLYAGLNCKKSEKFLCWNGGGTFVE